MKKKVGLLFIVAMVIGSLAYAQTPSAPSSATSGAGNSLSVSRSSQRCYGSSRTGWYPGKIAGKIVQGIKARRAQRRARRAQRQAQRQAKRAQRRCWPARRQIQRYPDCGDVKRSSKGFQPGRVTPQAPTLADGSEALSKELERIAGEASAERSILKPKTIALPLQSIDKDVFLVLDPELVSMAEAKKIEIKTVEIDGESKSVYKIGTVDQDNEALQESLNQLLKKLEIEGELKLVKETQ